MLNLSHYKLTELLQDGITTCIYHAVRIADGTPVTIKTCKEEYPTARDVLRLRHEYAILRELAEKGIQGIPRAYALESHGAGIALVLEALPGRSLIELIQAKPLDLRTVLHIGSVLAGLLDTLHCQRVIHKDIKPHNVLFNPETQQIYLVDFGIATRLSQEAAKPANPEALEGTLAYLAPEQTGRMNRPVDARSDFYSLGIMLYELLSGSLPFRSTIPMELVHSHIARRPQPLHEAKKSVPVVVSDIVMKLLSKLAEDRYQSGRGLKADLDACIEQLRTSGTVRPFPLGSHDRNGTLRIPQRLYGRASELRILLECFARVERGAVELLFLSGYSGVGKSALISEIHKPIARRGGFFIAGKFDQLTRNLPYAAFAQAFFALARQLLAESASELASWKERLLQHLGHNGRLLIELVPELELIIGPQPPVPELGPTESQNRFALLVQNFLHAFVGAGHPMVVFLDDLQWADQASLTLLRSVMTDPDLDHLLAIGAYRDNEVGRGHPLTVTVSALREAKVTVRELTLPPLSQDAVTTLVADAVQADKAHVAPLAELVTQKTQGNPFFINQFLTTLYQEQLLRFDADSGRWQWDLERTRAAMVTDNVLDFMVGKLQRLQPATQEVLKLGACVGFEFDLLTLTLISGRSADQIAADLWQALSVGLLIPQNEEYRFLYGASEADLSQLLPKGGLQVSFRFLHDRVQQAAYRLIAEEDRPSLHLRIGRLLLAQAERNQVDKRLFEILDHLSFAHALLQDPSECVAVARLCRTASRRAKSAAAYAAAAKYAELGLRVLGESGFATQHALCFELHVYLAESEHASGHTARAEELFHALFERAGDRLEYGRVTLACMALYTTMGRSRDSLRIGKACLERFGVAIPDTPEAAGPVIVAGYEEIYKSLGNREVEELLDAPPLDNPEHRMVLMLLLQAATAGYFIHPTLMVAPMTKHINLTIQQGNCELSAIGYAAMGSCTAGLHQRYAFAGRFAKLSLAVTERYPVSDTMAQVYFVAGAHSLPYVSPLREMPALLRRSIEVAMQVGDFIYASWSSYQKVMIRYYTGDELRVLHKDLDSARHLARRTREPVAAAFLQLSAQVLANLEGRTKGRATLNDDEFNETAFTTGLRQSGLLTPLGWYHTLKLQLAFLYGDSAAALEHAEAAQALSANAFIFYFLNELAFYHCLALCAVYAEASGEKRAEYEKTLASQGQFVATLAQSCGESYGHKHLLVLAETARIENKPLEAMDLYDRAIESAEQNGFIQVAALANELAARHYLALGRVRTARNYLRDAYAAYRRWGSNAKLSELTERYPQLLLGESARAQPRLEGTRVITSTLLLSSGLLDADMVLRFAQAIAGEIVLSKVIEQFLRIVVMNTAAQRGVLVLHRNDELIVEAAYSSELEVVELEKNEPLARCTELPVGVVQYAARSREPVLLNADELAARFSSDPYARERSPKSLLCLPMLHHNRLTGLLYLENNSASDVFTADRVELLHLLCAQGAIAIENALLYAHVQSVTTQLTHSNDELQSTNSRLQSVTAELGQSNRDLSAAHDRLQQEFAERARAEQSRAALQEEVIRVQSERLAELSTPIIPISAEIMVMPLIGTMDAQRAAQVLDIALAGAQSARARVVILDITGMRYVDTSVAGTLINTGKALRLLGTHAVLTGIRAEVAQTLVQLGVSLDAMVTRSTLQSGIAYAQQLVGKSRK